MAEDDLAALEPDILYLRSQGACVGRLDSPDILPHKLTFEPGLPTLIPLFWVYCVPRAALTLSHCGAIPVDYTRNLTIGQAWRWR